MGQSVINTFDKGLHKDSPPILQPQGTYTDMKNGMLISYDGNHYTVEMTKGNKILLTLTPRYLDVVADLDVEPMPIGFVSFIDKLVVFSTNSESTTGYGEIGVVSFTRVGMDFVGTYVPYYHHSDLNFTKIHKIEGFSFQENDGIARVYWTDYFNEPRVFDIANPMFTDYKVAATANELEDGKYYMVLIGAVTYNGVDYGPGLTTGNIIPATTAGGTSFTVADGSPLVIEYYPISLLDWTPTRLLGSIKFKEYGSGVKNCGNHIYFYRLSSTAGGYSTTWSYAASPILVGMDNEASFLTGINYKDFVGNGNATTVEASDKSVIVTIEDIDTNFDTIELACAEYSQVKDVPYSITIVKKETITGSSMDLEDIGNTNFGTVTITDLTLFPASILKCKTISTNKNYSIIANITEREEFQLDLSGITLGQVEYPLVAHGDLDLCVNGNVPEDVSPSLGVNPVFGEVVPYTRWLVTFGNLTTDTVIYEGVNYVTGEVITGGSIYATILFTGSGAVRPCTTKNRYTAISDSKRRENAIELTTGFWDYKDPAVSSHNVGYWSKDKYRFALVFFDTKGNPFYAKHLGDYTFDDINTKNGLILKDAIFGTTPTQYSYALNASGLNISGLDIPESVMNKCSGFSIMRAERDARILAQGLLTRNVLDDSTSYICYPEGNFQGTFIPTGRSLYPEVYCYVCPDLDYNGFTPRKPLGRINDGMEEAAWFSSSTINSFGISASGLQRKTYSKLFTKQAQDAYYPREFQVTSLNGSGFKTFSELGSEVNFDGSPYTYENRSLLHPDSASLGFIATVCSTVVPPTGLEFQSNGCLKKVFKSTSGINHYSSTNDYSNNAEINNNNKLLVNCVADIDPASQYGGSSDSAIAETLYMSTGHYQPINSTVKADTLNGTFSGGIYDGENKYTFNDIEIFGGDCFLCLVDKCYTIYNEASFTLQDSLSYAITFPCECNNNINLRRGRKVSGNGIYDAAGNLNGVAADPPNFESYSYNQGYSSEGTAIKYPALPLFYNFTGNFKYRLRWSGLKYPGELVDSFRVYRLPDYRDVDGQRGQVNNLKARDSKLFYWQDHSVGYTPILERQLVGGGAIGDATALGVTGVIDRYDDIDTFFGNQHQHGLVETEYGFAWFDMRRRAFMVMGIGTKPEEMSMVKGLQVFFNSEFDEGTIYYPNSYSAIYNTNNLNIPEVPLQGYGIVGVYDPTFKMTYLTFKYAKRDTAGENYTFVNRDFTLGYNHILNAFVSFTNNCPAIWHNHNDLVLTANNPKSTKSYHADMPPTTFVLGDTVQVRNVEYICYNPSGVYIPSYPPAATKDPEYSGSIYWLAINKTNEIYLQNFGADLCKFYGKVWDFEHEIVVNAKTDVSVTPQNMQVKSIGPNATSVYFSSDNQSSSDLNISSTNRNYRLIDGSWFFSVALDKVNGRITDYYVRVKFIHKNYVTNPTISKNIQKVTQWLKTIFVTKR